MSILIAIASFTILILGISDAKSCSLDPDDKATQKVKVLILGGGMAGISAARTLEINGEDDFVVLEAGSEIGGRIRRDPETGVELGASWIHGLDTNIKDKPRHPLWREWMNCDDGYGPDGSFTPSISEVYYQNGSMINILLYEELSEQIYNANAEIEEMASKLPHDISLREAFEMYGWEPMTALENFTEWLLIDYCIARKPDPLSTKLYYQSAYTDFLGDTETSETGDFVVSDKKGYRFIVDCLAHNFLEEKVKLNTAVTTINWADDCVCATVSGGQIYCGDYAILTFSIGVLQAALNTSDENRLKFIPELPPQKKNAIKNISLAHYARIYLIFDEPIMLTKETSEQQQIIGYVSDTRGDYPIFVVDRRHPNIIVVDVTDDLALEVEDQTKNKTKDEIMSILRKINLGSAIPEPKDIVISNWSIDPHFLCSWTAFELGTPPDIIEEVRSPLKRLYFAGESLNKSHYGYTHGAYGSGINITNKILSEMRNCKFK